MSEPIDTAAFGELIDDYQCAQLDGGLDERANARSALMNAYRAALGSSAAQSRDQWIDENVSGNKVLIQAMKNIADTASSDAQADGGKGEAVGEMIVRKKDVKLVAWSKSADLPEGKYRLYIAPQAECAPRVDDLSALVTRLARALRKAVPDNDLSEKALDYLKREGLVGSPLRAECAPREALTDDLRESFERAARKLGADLSSTNGVYLSNETQRMWLIARAIEQAAKENQS